MQAIEKQLIVLESIAKLKNNGDGFSIAEMSNETGLDKSTLHRICSVLLKRGYIYQTHKRGKYFIGHKFLLYSGINRRATGIKEQALPFLNKLSKDVSETVDLIIFDGMNLFSMVSILPNQVLQAVPNISDLHPFPFHATAVGKVLLASLPRDRVETEINNMVLTAYTDNAITDKDQLKNEIELVRRNKVAYDIEEYTEGISSIVAPIKDDDREVVGAVTIVGPSLRLSKLKLKQLTPVILDCALQVSRSLGYKGEL